MSINVTDRSNVAETGCFTQNIVSVVNVITWCMFLLVCCGSVGSSVSTSRGKDSTVGTDTAINE